MKTRPNAVGTAENEFGRGKHENGSRRPRFSRKMSPRAQHMKWDPDAIGTVENESGRAKHEIGT
jgi:hypothetical protein